MKTNSIVFMDEVDSTNRYLRDFIKENGRPESLFCVVAENQTAGRGQKGNTWHSTKGYSLTFSFYLGSGALEPQKQFVVSEFAAYGLYKTIKRYLTEEQAEHLKIKWPNDIYYKDKKLAGMLIEHSITGRKIDHSFIGIGLNLNQLDFPTELPNPISMKQITGEDYTAKEVVERIMKRFGFMKEDFIMQHYGNVHREYMEALYWRTGFHNFEDKDGEFTARIYDVQANGELVLERESGERKNYDIKDVLFKH